MLNTTFSKSLNQAVGTSYIAPDDIAKTVLNGNESMETGVEYRLQSVYGDEIWGKLVRAGVTPQVLGKCSVLEVCAGTGMLTYHLLSRCTPKSLTVNDISSAELDAARYLISEHYPETSVEYVVADMHNAAFDGRFDLIIGNSFVHHFHDVPKLLSRMLSLLNPGGAFISLHEPTPMSTIVESGKALVYPLAVLAPGIINDIVRSRYKGEPSPHDLWMFDPGQLKRLVELAGFASVNIYSWNLLRQMVVQKYHLHLSKNNPRLGDRGLRILSRAIYLDSVLNRLLPRRFFGSLCMVCHK